MKTRVGMTRRGGPLYCLLIALLSIVATVPAESQEQLLSKEKIEPVLRRHVLANGPWKPENVEVRVVPFPPVTLPAGPVSYRILRPLKGITPGAQNFLLAAEVAAKEETRLWVKTEVRVFDNVAVSSYPLARHEVVSAKDVRLERRELSSVTARPFTRIEDVIGRQAARPIEVNEILTPNSIDRPTLMRRGSSIVLVFETGSLRVETPGVAEEGGKAGELIQVKNPTSGKLLRGVVLDGRMVRVN